MMNPYTIHQVVVTKETSKKMATLEDKVSRPDSSRLAMVRKKRARLLVKAAQREARRYQARQATRVGFKLPEPLLELINH
jgi:phosphoribosylaminoimidazole-succinocarboxamide synthase